MTMLKKVLCAAAAACLLLANNGSCIGGVNSASGSAVRARICEAASRVGAAADTITQALTAIHVAQEKIDALVPLIQRGRLLITVTCAIVLPAPTGSASAPVAAGVT
jgi:hypothetical protein